MILIDQLEHTKLKSLQKNHYTNGLEKQRPFLIRMSL